MSRGASLSARELHEPQPISNELASGVGFPHRKGRYRRGGSLLSSPGFRSRRCMECFLIRGWDPIFPGVLWLYIRTSQPISNQLVGLGLPHRAGRCCPERTPFSFPSRPSCRFIRISDPEMGTYSPRVRWLYVRAPTNQESASGGLGFPYRAGRCQPRESPFPSPVCPSCNIY